MESQKQPKTCWVCSAMKYGAVFAFGLIVGVSWMS